MVTWIIGLSAAGKTTLGKIMYDVWKKEEPNTVFIDGDVVRSLFDNPGYTVEARKKNADFICKLCKWLDGQNINVICCILSIFEESRRWNRQNYSRYYEVYIDVPMQILKERDSKGLYSGKVKHVVGLDIPFDHPRNSDYVFDNSAYKTDFQLKVEVENIFSKMQIYEKNIPGRKK